MNGLLKNSESGVSLIEILIGLTISLILLGVAAKMLLVQNKSVVAQEQETEMLQYIRSSMAMMLTEIRMAGYDPTSAGIGGVTVAGTETITFSADFDGSGALTGTETITYAYDDVDDQIDRTTSSNQPLADNIEALSFVYLDDNGLGTTTVSSIRQIQIIITGRTADPDPHFGYRYGTLSSYVTPKNLGY